MSNFLEVIVICLLWGAAFTQAPNYPDGPEEFAENSIHFSFETKNGQKIYIDVKKTFVIDIFIQSPPETKNDDQIYPTDAKKCECEACNQIPLETENAKENCLCDLKEIVDDFDQAPLGTMNVGNIYIEDPKEIVDNFDQVPFGTMKAERYYIDNPEEILDDLDQGALEIMNAENMYINDLKKIGDDLDQTPLKIINVENNFIDDTKTSDDDFNHVPMETKTAEEIQIDDLEKFANDIDQAHFETKNAEDDSENEINQIPFETKNAEYDLEKFTKVVNQTPFETKNAEADDMEKLTKDVNQTPFETKNAEDDSKKITNDINQVSFETKNANEINIDDSGKFTNDITQTTFETKTVKQTKLEDVESYEVDVVMPPSSKKYQTPIRIKKADPIFTEEPENFLQAALKNPRKVLNGTCKIPSLSDILKVQYDAFNKCISLCINGSELLTDLDDARKTRSVDLVFDKYCAKWSEIYDCIDNATSMSTKSYRFEDKNLFNQTIDIVKGLQEHLCSRNSGNRLERFVAGGGVECFHAKYQGIKNCYNGTIFKFPQKGNFLETALFMLMYSSRNCGKFHKTQACVYEVLEKCPANRPAFVVDASFRFVDLKIGCDEDFGLALKVWYFVFIYVIAMVFYFYLIIQQDFEVRGSERLPTV